MTMHLRCLVRGSAHYFVRAIVLIAIAAPALAQSVVDDFESDANPNGWGWVNIDGPPTIVAQGGNPGGWFDTGVPYFATHPSFTAVPPAGSALRAALSSKHLLTATIDLERLDTSSVPGCLPTHTEASFVSLALADLHSAHVAIEARTTKGPTFPLGSFPWESGKFYIDSDATQTPPGWELINNSDLVYTWADLMRNVDAIRFYVGNPDQQAFSACSHLGADNVVITYLTSDVIFADNFDTTPGP